MKKYLIIIYLILLGEGIAIAQSNLEDILKELDNVIDERELFHRQKHYRIDSIRVERMKESQGSNPDYLFETYLILFEEYSAFIYDSAFQFAVQLQEQAKYQNDKEKMNVARLKLGFTFLSGGLFHEVLDTLSLVDTNVLSDEYLLEYYYLMARVYFEIAEYSNDNFYSLKYDSLGRQHLISAIEVAKPNSSQEYSMMGLYNLRVQNNEKAKKVYEELFLKYSSKLNLHQFAIEATSYSWVFRNNNKHEEASILLAKAAIADIKTTTKETVALRLLAQQLFSEGEVQRAYNYINIALEEATFYEANHRKMQISKVLPIIERERLRLVEEQNKKLIRYFIGLSVLSILVIVLIVLVLKQIRKIKSGQTQLEKANSKLTETIINLRDANKIKEEYIANFFDGFSENIQKIEKLKKTISRLLTTRNYSEIQVTIRNLDLKKEREKLFIDFDRIFLGIFPNFIDQLNKLFKDGDKLIVGKDQALPPEVRIVALIRLGISDGDKIANILNYSLNTIYTYKTKIRNRSVVSNEEFEEEIMKIRVVD